MACSAGSLRAAPPTPAPLTLPTNGQVIAGTASISQTQTPTTAAMMVNQTSQRAVVNWDSFNVGKNATVTFNQPNANAVTLNRVTGATASMIDGAVKANGQVVFVNPSGVTFGKGSEINAAGVVATTMDISNKDFMDGKSTYKGNGKGSVINEGKITTNTEGGYIALLAPEVRNDGYLLAKKGSGTVAMAAGEQITLDFKGNSLISVKVDVGTYNTLIENKRVVEVNGGLVVIAAGSANQLMASVIKNTGRISASSMVNNGGVIELVANTVTQAGKVSANSKTAEGGQINIVGNELTITSNSKTIATGATNGGQVNIGLANTQVTGGSQVNAPSNTQSIQNTQAVIKANAEQAANTKQLAQTVTIEENALIDTSATTSGNGGAIAIWSQVKTTVAGILKSMGGSLSGNGGLIETSSKGIVNLTPTVQINTSANNQTGKAGTWLLDSIDLTIDVSTANLISAVLANSNVTIAVTNNTNTCPIGSCTQNGTGSLTIASGADILKLGTNLTTLTLNSSGIFNLNANISGQNLSVIISSSIAYLNVGTTITASEVTVQAQTIYSAGTIQTSNYLANSSKTLGNAIKLLAQAIYVSGRLSANSAPGAGVLSTAGTIKLEANTITLNPGATLEASGDEGGYITIAANDSLWNSALIQVNGGNGRGGTLLITAVNDIHFDGAQLLANGTTDGGVMTITTQVGDVNIANSTIQTNGSTGRGGSIGLSATNNTQIANSSISANGYTQGGIIKIGNDATGGSLPFSLVTNLDANTVISAAQLDPNPSNQAGGYIETSGHTLNLLATINAGRGGMWLLDPNDISIEGLPVLGGTPFVYVSGSSYTYTAVASSVVYSALISSALASADVVITTANGDITVNGSISGAHSLTLIASAGNIQVNAGIQLTGRGSSIILKAQGFIATDSSVNGPNTFRTNGGDVIFWSNTGNVTNNSAASANFIYLDSGTKVLTNGGAIYLAGGSSSALGTNTANGNPFPTGSAFAGSQTIVSTMSGSQGVSSGILLGPYANSGIPITLNSAGGNIVISGQTSNTGLPGFSSQASFVIDSGVGAISLYGQSHLGNGMELAYGSSDANIVISSSSTLASAIQINGRTDCGSCMAFWATNNSQSNTPGVLIQATGVGGGIILSGVNTANGLGVFLSGTDVLAASGPIVISGNSLVTQSMPVYVGACSGSSSPCLAFNVDGNIYMPITSSSANVAMNVDARSIGGYLWAGVLKINTTGTLTIAPYTPDGWAGTTFSWSGTNLVSGSVNTFVADADSFIGVADKLVVQGITGLSIGNSTSTNIVNISQDLSPFGDIRIVGGRINLNAPIAGLRGNLSLRATTGDININAAATWGSGSVVSFNAFRDLNINAPVNAPYGTLNVTYGGSYTGNAIYTLYVLFDSGTSVYGSNPSLSYGIYADANGLLPALPSLLNLIVGNIRRSGALLNANTAVGSYSLVYSSGLASSNLAFSLVAGNAKTWMITPKPITITNNAVSAIYDAKSSYADLVSAAGYTLSAPLVSGDVIGALREVVTIGGSLSNGIAQAGEFISTPGAAVLAAGNAANYVFTYISSINKVAKAPLIVKASSLKREAGTTFSGGNGVSYIGLLNNDQATAISGVLSYTGSSQGASSAGTYVIQPSGLSSQNYAIDYAPGDLVLTPQVLAPPVFIPPPLVAPVIPPPPPPSAAPFLAMVAPPPNQEAAPPAAGQAAPPVRAAMTVVAPDGTISLGAAPPPSPPAPPPGAISSGSTSSEGRPSGGKSVGGASERSAKAEAKKLASLSEGAEKGEGKKSASATTPASKYVSKYANGFRPSEKSVAKGGPKETANKPGANTAKSTPAREGKYSGRVNALANSNSGGVSAPLAQAQFSSNGLPPLPGVPVGLAMPTVLRGGDSLAQSYDDVPSIRNSGVANAGRSRNTENYHESLESVNLMSTLNLFIVH